MTRISRRDFVSRSAALAAAGMSAPGWMSLAGAAHAEGAATASIGPDTADRRGIPTCTVRFRRRPARWKRFLADSRRRTRPRPTSRDRTSKRPLHDARKQSPAGVRRHPRRDRAKGSSEGLIRAGRSGAGLQACEPGARLYGDAGGRSPQ
jgi:hypothetical protein